jgi:two-component system sensor histidine kinase TctE
MIALLGGELALVGIAILLLRPALGWSLRPLARLRGAVEAREGHAAPDLSPIDAGPLPLELRPLAEAFDRLLAQLDTATAATRRFTADASHQMRTPLSVLKVQIELARRGSREALDEIATAAARLERLLIQLLALARAEEAGAAPPLERVDLREVAVRVISRRIGQAIDAGVELQLDAAAAPAWVHGHRTLLVEILSNLIDNGIRYNRRGGTVTVAIRDADGGVDLSVRDDGPGIAAADRDRALERFVRLGDRHAPDGSGLGLAVVRSAAARIGATLRLADAEPGLAVLLHLPDAPSS